MNDLIKNINKIHTTDMGLLRIKNNLSLNMYNIVDYCKERILKENAFIYKNGKNWYCEVDNIKITINSNSYTIITAHFINK